MPYEQRICQTCGNQFRFLAAPSILRQGGGKYCSYSCHAKTRTAEKNPNWRGGKIQDGRGRAMVYAPNHPGARLCGGSHIYEYRLIAEQKIGRTLADNEIVHHINGDATDNRPENLEVMTQSEHAKLHMRGDSNPNIKITDEQVRELRKLWPTRTSTRALAEQFGINKSTVWGIAIGRSRRGA